MKESTPREILKFANVFKYHPKFNVNGQDGYNSLFSFFLSLLFLILFFLMSITFSSDWIYQTNPNISVTGRDINELGKFEINLDRFVKNFVVKKTYSVNKNITDILKNGNLKLNEIFKIKISIEKDDEKYFEFERNLQAKIFGEEIRIDQTISRNNTFKLIYDKDEKYLEEKNIKLSDIKFDYEKDLIIDISYENKLFNEAKKQDFLIHQNYSNFRLTPNTYYFDVDEKDGLRKDDFYFSTVDPLEKTYSNIDKKYNYLDRYNSINLGMIEVEDHRGNIFSDIFKNFQFAASINNSFLSNERMLCRIFFIDKMSVYIRRFKKIQNVFADIGGILNCLILIFTIISDILNAKFFDYEIVNLLFENATNKEIESKINNNFELKSLNFIKKKKNYNDNDNDNYNNHDIDNNNKIIDRFQIDIASNRDLIHRKKLDIQNEIQNRSVSLPCEELNYKSIIENSNFNLNSNIDINDNENNNKENNNNNNIEESNNDKENNQNFIKENLKQEIEKLKKDHGIKRKRGEKLFFKKEKEKEFITLNRIEFIKLFIPIKKIKSENYLLKEKIFETASQKISQYLDIFNLFDLQEDFLKLKMILLDKNQFSLFDFIKKRSFEEISGEKYFEDLIESIIYFKENKKNINMSMTDKRILENIDDIIDKYIL
jgi:hypothetical protein